MLKKIERPSSDDPDHSDRRDPQQTYLTVHEIVNFFSQFMMSIAIVAMVPIALAFLYLAVTPPVYTARAQIVLDPHTPQPMRDNSDVGSVSFDSPYIDSQVAVIRSEAITTVVAQDLKLFEDDEFVGGLKLQPGERSSNAEVDFERKRAIAATMARGLEVQRTGLSYAIEINFTSRSADKAAIVANAVAEAFVRDQIETRSATIRAGGRWLEQRIDELRRQMNAAALNVQRFKLKRDYRVADQARAADHDSGLSVAEANPQSITLEELDSTAQTYRRIYESYLQAYTESLQRQSLPGANARIITPATRPRMPSAPKKALILILALLIGLLAGLAQALVRYQLRTT